MDKDRQIYELNKQQLTQEWIGIVIQEIQIIKVSLLEVEQEMLDKDC